MKTQFGNIVIITEAEHQSIDFLAPAPEVVSGYDQPRMAVMTSNDPQRFELMQWGYVPRQFGGNAEIMSKIGILLNARAETVLEKASFKNSIRHRRCIIPLEGFYDYQHRGTGRTKHTQLYYIDHCDGLLFAAGVWDEFEGLKTFAIVTTAANPLMTEIHNKNPRQPHIINPEDWSRWLGPLSDDEIMGMLSVYPDDKLKATEYHTPPPEIKGPEPGSLF